MEFSPRGFQRNGSRPFGAPGAGAEGPVPQGNPNPIDPRATFQKVRSVKPFVILSVLLLVALVILLIAMLTGMFSKKNSEASLIDKTRYQAVFLSNGQVYFGKIDQLNNEYLDLQDIYYLNVSNQSVQPTQQNSAQNVSLVKLGCELHSPQDTMVIYRTQVTFWENLKDEGQVATAIQEWKKQNPNGQKCSQTTTQQQPTTQTTPTTTPTTSPTPTPSTSSQSSSSQKTTNSSSSGSSNSANTTPTTSPTPTPSPSTEPTTP
jgi:hypothetical protein